MSNFSNVSALRSLWRTVPRFHDLIVCEREMRVISSIACSRYRQHVRRNHTKPSHRTSWIMTGYMAPCPYDTSVQLASPCRQLLRCHIHTMHPPMYVRFTYRWSLWFPIDIVSSPVVMLHAHGVNRLADRPVTPRHATPRHARLASAKPSPPQPLAKWTLLFKLRQAN